MVVANCLSVCSVKFVGCFRETLNLLQSSTALRCSPLLNSQFSPKICLRCSCSKDEVTEQPIEGFQGMALDSPWESESVWSTMGLYVFSLHIPLSFGGLSVVAHILHQSVLDPQSQILSLLGLQILELGATLLLLASTMKPHFKLNDIFKANKASKERNWLLASALGFGFLVLLVFLTSLLADIIVGPKDVNNPIVKDIIQSDNVSKAATILVYCVSTPLLEETVYRGFLLAALSSKMKWQQAIIISSAVFSAAHFSGESFVQLFLIESVLGCSYCWTGNIRSPIMIHSLYNALTLFITLYSYNIEGKLRGTFPYFYTSRDLL